MRTIELTLPVGEALQELLIARLTDLDFAAFEQEETRLRAYVPAARWSDVHREQIEQWLRRHGIREPLTERVYEPQDWNAAWERTVQPLAVGPFLVKPTWADVPPAHAEKLLLEIDPKMSFGTGYHESTRLALRLLPALDAGAPHVLSGAHVLDAGTGTGILAIAALRLGAATAVAFDTDDWAFRNATENALLNGVAAQMHVRQGALEEVVPEGEFGLVLANINRGVLLDVLPALARRLSAGGRLVLSGLLRADRARMVGAAAAQGLAVLREETEGDWWAAAFVVEKKGTRMDTD